MDHLVNQSNFINRQVTRCTDGLMSRADDMLAVEEPLEIRVAGETMAVTMRMPGNDRFLSLGFLYGEGIISGIDDVGRASHCGRPGTPEYGNTFDVIPAPGVVFASQVLEKGKRGTLTTSACGVCGRERIDDLVARCKPLDFNSPISYQTINSVLTKMKNAQPVFTDTGGVHAAALFDSDGEMMACFEDVGRHNAVDKAIGKMLDEKVDLSDQERPHLLTVSSRASFEIVQKAAVAQIGTVVAVSAASSLAVELAEAMGITLVGFARGDRMVCYTGEICA